MPSIVARVSCIASMAFGFIYFAQASAPVPLAVAHGAQAIAGIATHFPIEVFNGADATGANTTTLANGVGIGGAVQEVTLAMTNAAAAKSLWLETHGLTYQDKASVQINNSLWVSLNNTSTIVSGIGKFYGGIGGAFRHLFITFTLQPGALVDGSNTIRFRFNKTDGRSMGYRVLNLNVLDAEGNPLLADPPLPLEDPATWQPPLNDAASIAAGATLWSARNRLVASPLAQDSTPIKASCADCHAQNGFDLKYFNYSNAAIIENAKFHGLNATEATQIASFIRARNVAYVAGARPWNPPYQPGPGLDAKPMHEWAAGAGVNAILTRDAELRNYLPDQGNNPNALYEGNRFKRVNLRELPISFELPDWNQWLPSIHPLDSVGNTFTTTTNYGYYAKVRQGLLGQLGMSKDEYVYKLLRQDLDAWTQTWWPGSGSNEFLALGSLNGTWTPTQVKQQYAAAIWGATKWFEIMHEFDLEGVARRLYGLQAEPRQWVVNRQLFNVAPQVLGMGTAYPVAGDGAALLTNSAFSNSWQWLQLILNPSARNAATGGFETIEWGLLSEVMSGVGYAAQRTEPMRASVYTFKAMEQADTGYAPDGRNLYRKMSGPFWGWDMRDNTPRLANFWQQSWWGNVANAKPLLTTMYELWLERGGTFTPQQLRGTLVSVNPPDNAGVYAMPPTTYTIPSFVTPTLAFEDAAMFHDFHIRYAREELGLDDAIPNAMTDLGAVLWPNNPWATLKRQSGAGPAQLTASVGVERVTVAWSPVVSATSYNLKRSYTAGGPFLAIGLFITQTTFLDRDLLAGQPYYYKVSANAGVSETNDSTTTVLATPLTGLVGYWTFDTYDSAAISDTSITANPSQAMGVVTMTLGHLGGVGGNAVQLGPQAFIAAERNMRWLSSDFTFAAWVKTTATGQSDLSQAPMLAGNMGEPRDNYVDVQWDKTGNRVIYLGALDEAGKLNLKLGLSTTAVLKSSAAVNDGNWHHVAFTRDSVSGDAKIYVDGQLSASGVLTPGYLSQRAFGLGRPEHGRVENFWQGALDEVRIYDRPLNDAEIQAVYKAAELPSLTPTPTLLPTVTRTPSATATPTMLSTATSTATFVPTQTPVSAFTPTVVPVSTDTTPPNPSGRVRLYLPLILK